MLANTKQNNIHFQGKFTDFFNNNIDKIKLSKKIKNEMLEKAKDEEEIKYIKSAHLFRILRIKELYDLGVDIKKAYIYSYDGGYLFQKIKKIAQAGKFERYDFLTQNKFYGEKLYDIMDMSEENYSKIHDMIASNIRIGLVLDFLKDYPDKIETICALGSTEQIDSNAIPFFFKKEKEDKNFNKDNVLVLAQTKVFTEKIISEILTFNKTNIINSEKFNEISPILAKLKANSDNYFDACYSEDYMKNKIIYQSYDYLLNEIFSIHKMDLEEYPLDNKLKIYFELYNVFNSNLLNEEEIKKIKLPEVLAKLEKSIKNPIAIFDIRKEDKELFFKNFIANNSPQIENTIKNFDFKKYEKNGLPLKYPRKEYLKDLDLLLCDCNENKKAEIYKKLEITVYDKNGYDGILTTDNLDLNDELENKIYSLTNSFINENEIITNDKEFNKIANSIIKAIPEFLNIIGKEQHRNQTLDVHSFIVVQNVLKDKNYETLSNKEKTILKFCALLHDIAKKEFLVDKNHPKKSALYSNCVLNHFNYSQEFKNTIIDIIENHHWFEQYSKGLMTAQKIARKLRDEEKFNLAKILTKADLKGVSEEFYKYHAEAFNHTSSIIASIQKINNNSQIIFTNKIINPKLLPKIKYKDKEYKVIDFSKYSKDDDLSKIGFEPKTTKEKLRLMVHMSNKLENLEAVMKISDTNISSLLCASYISLKNKATYNEYKFGLNLDVPNKNIINASKINQLSGRKKGDEQMENILNNNSYRQKIPASIKSHAKLSDIEYRDLYSKMLHFKYFSQIKDKEFYHLSEKVVLGKDLKYAIKISSDSLLHAYHNEINLYKPTPNAFVAKVNSIEEIPDKYLDFARKHDLAILILGK